MSGFCNVFASFVSSDKHFPCSELSRSGYKTSAHCVSVGHTAVHFPTRWSTHGASYAEVLAGLPARLVANFAALFASGGDVCAMLYCNSPAMHGGPIRQLADPKLVTKDWTRSNAYIFVQRLYQSAVKDQRRTYMIELFLGRHWRYLFPRMGCRYLTRSECVRSVYVMDSARVQEHIAELLLGSRSGLDHTLQRDTIIAEAVIEMMGTLGEINEIFVNNYTLPIVPRDRLRRPLCLLVYAARQWDPCMPLQLCNLFEYVSVMAPSGKYMEANARGSTPPPERPSVPATSFTRKLEGLKTFFSKKK